MKQPKIRRANYTAFEEKIVVCTSQGDAELIFPFYEADDHRNVFPKFFDTYPQAIIALCDYVKEIALSFHLKLNTYKNEHKELVFPSAYAFALADLDKTGHLQIYFEPDGETSFEPQILYEGHIINLIKEQKYENES